MNNNRNIGVVFIFGLMVGAVILGIITNIMVRDLQSILVNQTKDIDNAFRSFIVMQNDSLKTKEDINHKLDLLKSDLDSIKSLLLLNLLKVEIAYNSNIPEKPIVYRKSFLHLNGRDNLKVTVTAYTNTVEETDNTPNITATGEHVSPKYIACSRDIIDQWGYGTKVILAIKTENGSYFKFGEYEIQDTMNENYVNSCDLFMWNKEEAVQFGKRKMRLIKL